jgi:polysaccharide biosynthesis protein PslJ
MSQAVAATHSGEAPLPGVSARTERLVYLLLGLTVVVLIATAVTRTQATVTLGAVTLTMVVIAGRRVLLGWTTLLGLLLVILLMVPMKRYAIGGGFPFQLEPYRLAIALLFSVWIAAVMVDPETRARRTGLEPPLTLMGIAIVASLATNVGRATSLSGDVIRTASTWLGFAAVMYITAGSIRTRRQLDWVIGTLVVGGAIVAIEAIIESRTGRNYFNELERIFPILDFQDAEFVVPGERGGEARAYASAQHAIPLGAMLAMFVPLAVYLFKRTGRKPWLAAALVLVMGAFATTSRTAVVMLIVIGLVFLWLKRAAVVRMSPLILPGLMVIQILMPGTLGTFRAIFFPKQGLIAEEQEGEGTGTGRLADVGPSLQEWGRQPLFGQGFGTRLTSQFDHARNARILDDQWLSSLLEVGGVGVAALLWLIIRAIRRLKFLAKHDDSDYGWLLTALAASIYAFAVGMFTYDAFAFYQVTFMLWILLGVAAAALELRPRGAGR